jgi:HAD superfamily hydrolase (TIGR01509 family)
MSHRASADLARTIDSPLSKRFSAVVFDLDGTMVDNMSWHAEAFDAFALRYGLPPMTLETRRRIDGKRNREIFPLLFEREMAIEEVRAYEREKEGAYRELSKGRLAPLTGLVHLLDRLELHKVPVAIATSAPPENVVHTLEEIGLAHRVPTIVRGDQVPRGKPEPDVFLRAAHELGVAPADCVAFEDAPIGITAAVRAGMRVVAVTTTFSREAFESSDPPPHAIYRDYDDFLGSEGRWLLSERR